MQKFDWESYFRYDIENGYNISHKNNKTELKTYIDENALDAKELDRKLPTKQLLKNGGWTLTNDELKAGDESGELNHKITKRR